MLHFFSAEKALENNFSEEQVRTVIHALQEEGETQEVIYHREDKESFRYVITTNVVIDIDEQLIQATSSVEKFKLEEDEFLEFVPDTLDSNLEPEKKYTLPLEENHDDQESLQLVAVKHLRCIHKVEETLAHKKSKVEVQAQAQVQPTPTPTSIPVPVQKNGNRTTLLLFALLIALIVGSLFALRPLFTNKQSADLSLVFNTVNVHVQMGTEQYTSKGNRLDLTLPLGRYRLQITKQGFKPVRQDIFLADDEEISIHLEEMYTLTVYADMEESRVLLDGNIVGTTGRIKPLELSLTTGEYALSLTNPSVAKPLQKKILLQGDQVIRAEFPHPRLTIRTNINDAIVAVADREYQIQGKELVLKLPFGRHQLIIRKSGYSPVVHEVVIQKQDQVVPITLERTTYHLSIIPNVANSTISVSCANEQKYFGTASPGKPFQVKTSAQSCNVFAEKQGYQHVNQKVSLIADQDLHLTLQKLFLLKVYTDLEQSIIVLDGKKVGKAGSKTPAVLSLPRGTYVLTASHPLALASVQQKIRLTKDRRLDIKLPLPQLTVKVNVAGVMLLIDQEQEQEQDKQYDKNSRRKQWIAGRQVTLRLTRGIHHLTAQKRGYITMQRQVLVQDNTQTSFTLVPAVYPLSIRSNVDKTAIYVKCKDGKEYTGLASSKVPFQLEAVAGTCTVSATLAGYNNIQRTVTLPSEKNISLHLSVAVQKEREAESALQIISTSKVKPTSFQEERIWTTQQGGLKSSKVIKTLQPRKKKERVKSESQRRREFIRPVRNPISKSTTRSRRNIRRTKQMISKNRTQSTPLLLPREAKKKTVKMNSVLVCQSYAIDI